MEKDVYKRNLKDIEKREVFLRKLGSILINIKGL
jgi:hypothetical protein